MRLPGKNAIRPANSTASRPCPVQIHFRCAHERPPPLQRKPDDLESDERTPAYCDPATLGTPTDVPNFSAARIGISLTETLSLAHRGDVRGGGNQNNFRTRLSGKPAAILAAGSWDSPSHSAIIVPQRTSSMPGPDVRSIVSFLPRQGGMYVEKPTSFLMPFIFAISNGHDSGTVFRCTNPCKKRAVIARSHAYVSVDRILREHAVLPPSLAQ